MSDPSVQPGPPPSVLGDLRGQTAAAGQGADKGGADARTWNSLALIVPALPDDLPPARRLVDHLGSQVDEIVISTEPGGCGVARNHGARSCRSDVLIFMDADAWLDPPQAIECFRRAREDFWVPRVLRNCSSDPLYTEFALRFVNTLNGVHARPWLVGTFFAVRREVYWAVGGSDPQRTFEDIDLGRKLSRSYRWGAAPVTVEVRRKYRWYDPAHAAKKARRQRARLGSSGSEPADT